MKTCTKCGTQMADEAVACPNCGCGAAPAVQLSTNRSLLKYILLGIITLGIVPLVWHHKMSARVGTELARRGIDYSFGASTFWLWGILGSIIVVGPFIYTYKLLKSMNLLAADYNAKG